MELYLLHLMLLLLHCFFSNNTTLSTKKSTICHTMVYTCLLITKLPVVVFDSSREKKKTLITH